MIKLHNSFKCILVESGSAYIYNARCLENVWMYYTIVLLHDMKGIWQPSGILVACWNVRLWRSFQKLCFIYLTPTAETFYCIYNGVQ